MGPIGGICLMLVSIILAIVMARTERRVSELGARVARLHVAMDEALAELQEEE